METFLQDKKVKVSILVLLVIVSLFTVSRLVTEVIAISTPDYQMNSISVQGVGEILAVSDIANLTINLSKDGATAKEAQTLLNESITKSLAYLKTQNIADKDIKSEYGGLNPKYSYAQPVCYTYPCPTKDPKIIGYTANQTIAVKVREVDNASVIRTGLAEIGVTDISGPTFSIDDEKGYQKEARALAIEDARKDAKVLAKNLGVKLGDVMSYYEEGGQGCCGYYSEKSSVMMMDAAGASAPTPVLPKGENKITSNVTVTYEIK